MISDRVDAAVGYYNLEELRTQLMPGVPTNADRATLQSLRDLLAFLARYARVPPEVLARWQQHRDPAARR